MAPSSTNRRVVAAALVLAATALSACGSSSNDPKPTRTSASSASGAFYKPADPLPAAAPGTLIRSERVTGIPLRPPSRIYRMLYHSIGAMGADVAVSGFALVPTRKATAPRPVYAWGHGTAGLGDACAPSHDVREHLPPFGGQALDRGAIVVATDYEGLGTPGVPTQSDGAAEGRAILDSVRAAASLPGVGSFGDVIVAGHSQGGPAALFAAQVSGAYAPELHVGGVMAFAPGAELPTLADSLTSSAAKGLVLVGAAGMRAAHPDLDLAALLTPKALGELARVEHACVDDVLHRYAKVASSELFRAPPSSIAPVRDVLVANSPGAQPIAAPVLVLHGTDDEQVPVEISERVRDAYCALGGNVTRHVYRNVDHDGVIDASGKDALAFMRAVLSHQPIANGC